MTTLFVPLCPRRLLGIVLRGAASRSASSPRRCGQARLFGAVFAASSVVTPFFLGAVAGAIASGRVPADGRRRPVDVVDRADVARRRRPRRRSRARSSPPRSSPPRPPAGGDPELAERCRRRATRAPGWSPAPSRSSGSSPSERRRAARWRRASRPGRARSWWRPRSRAGAPWWLLWRRPLRAGPRRRGAWPSLRSSSAGASPSTRGSSSTRSTIDDGGRRPADARRRCSWCSALAAVTVVPALVYLFWLTQQQAWAATDDLEPAVAPDERG